MQYIYDIKSGLLPVRENEISLHKWSVGTAHLRTVEGTLPLGVATLHWKLCGAVRKNIISDRFSTKTAISAHI